MTAPPPNSPLAELVSGTPIGSLEQKRNGLRDLVADFEAAITEAEEREARIKARQVRRADNVAPTAMRGRR